jgi:hypothetical protein
MRMKWLSTAQDRVDVLFGHAALRGPDILSGGPLAADRHRPRRHGHQRGTQGPLSGVPVERLLGGVIGFVVPGRVLITGHFVRSQRWGYLWIRRHSCRDGARCPHCNKVKAEDLAASGMRSVRCDQMMAGEPANKPPGPELVKA